MQIDSKWEDCLYRIEALNTLLFMVDSMTEDVNRVKKYMQVESFEKEVVSNMISKVLDNLSESRYRRLLPDLPARGFTQLDKLTLERREREWALLLEDTDSLRTEIGRMTHGELLMEIEDQIIPKIKELAVEVSADCPISLSSRNYKAYPHSSLTSVTCTVCHVP